MRRLPQAGEERGGTGGGGGGGDRGDRGQRPAAVAAGGAETMAAAEAAVAAGSQCALRAGRTVGTAAGSGVLTVAAYPGRGCTKRNAPPPRLPSPVLAARTGPPTRGGVGAPAAAAVVSAVHGAWPVARPPTHRGGEAAPEVGLGEGGVSSGHVCRLAGRCHCNAAQPLWASQLEPHSETGRGRRGYGIATLALA